MKAYSTKYAKLKGIDVCSKHIIQMCLLRTKLGFGVPLGAVSKFKAAYIISLNQAQPMNSHTVSGVIGRIVLRMHPMSTHSC